MTIDDLIGAVRLADLSLSPDGRTVVYMRETTTDLKSGRRNANLWAVPAEGGIGPKDLIGGGSPRTRRGGARRQAAGVHLDPRRRIPNLRGGCRRRQLRKVDRARRASQPPMIFSPDGTRVAFVSDVYPECPDEACNARAQRKREKNPVKAHRSRGCCIATGTSGARTSAITCSSPTRERTRVVDLTPGDFDSPPAQQRRRGARVLARRQGAGVRIEPRRQRSAKRGRRTTTSGRCPVTGGAREEADARIRRPTCSRCSRADGQRS